VITLKAIVVDIDGDYLIVANSRGDFIRIYNDYPGCQVGDEITVRETKAGFFGSMLSSFAKKKALVVAACFMLMLITSYSVYGYLNPVTYVTIDINPSVEFSLNRYDLVRDVCALNEDGKIIIGDGREYKNMKFDKALNLLLSRAVEAEFLNEDANTVMLTVSSVKDSTSSNKKQQLQEIAEKQLHKVIEREEESSSLRTEQATKGLATEETSAQGTNKRSIKIIVENTTYEKHQEAKRMAISQGKLVLYEKLKRVKPDVALEHIKETPVGQILKELEKIGPKDKPGPESRPSTNRDDKRQGNDKKEVMNHGQLHSEKIREQKDHRSEQMEKIQKEQKNKIKDKIKEVNEKIKDAKDQLKEALKETREKGKDLKEEKARKKENTNEKGKQKEKSNDNRKSKQWDKESKYRRKD